MTPVWNGSVEENGVGKFSSFTEEVLKGLVEMGVTHVWYTGILEHATTTRYEAIGKEGDPEEEVKGKAGSPYAVRDYYDVDADLSEVIEKRVEEFEELVGRTHEAGLKVIIDFIPNHVSRGYRSDKKPEGVEDFREENYYIRENGEKETGGEGWSDTAKLRYTEDTKEKMIGIMQYWVSKGVDGFRCDMAELIGVEFWGEAIRRIKSEKEVIYIGEVYREEKYREYIEKGGFDYLYDKVGLYEVLRGVIRGDRRAEEISWELEKLSDIREKMLHFLENHDEVRIASRYFGEEARKGYPGMIVVATISESAFMIYFGQELGEKGEEEEGYSGLDGKTTIFDYWSVPVFKKEEIGKEEREVKGFYRRLCQIAMREEPIRAGAYYRLEMRGAGELYGYMRYVEEKVIIVALNFSKEEVKGRVVLTAAAFKASGMEENVAMEIEDLFSGEKELVALTSEWGYEVKLPGYGWKMVKVLRLGLGKKMK
ncbi:MAG: alpha-amylase [Tannerellaceae bacterium]|jgi:glycosidase|nr:alpha-amylase [Tannerellaceae bacterium]